MHRQGSAGTHRELGEASFNSSCLSCLRLLIGLGVLLLCLCQRPDHATHTRLSTHRHKEDIEDHRTNGQNGQRKCSYCLLSLGSLGNRKGSSGLTP